MSRYTKFLIGTLLLLPIVTAAAPAYSEQPVVCSSHAEIVKLLHGAYREAPVSAALTDNGQMLEVFASDTGSWTMVITVAGGPSCMMATGQNWESLATQRVNLPGA